MDALFSPLPDLDRLSELVRRIQPQVNAHGDLLPVLASADGRDVPTPTAESSTLDDGDFQSVQGPLKEAVELLQHPHHGVGGALERFLSNRAEISGRISSAEHVVEILSRLSAAHEAILRVDALLADGSVSRSLAGVESAPQHERRGQLETLLRAAQALEAAQAAVDVASCGGGVVSAPPQVITSLRTACGSRRALIRERGAAALHRALSSAVSVHCSPGVSVAVRVGVEHGKVVALWTAAEKLGLVHEGANALMRMFAASGAIASITAPVPGGAVVVEPNRQESNSAAATLTVAFTPASGKLSSDASATRVPGVIDAFQRCVVLARFVRRHCFGLEDDGSAKALGGGSPSHLYSAYNALAKALCYGQAPDPTMGSSEQRKHATGLFAELRRHLEELSPKVQLVFQQQEVPAERLESQCFPTSAKATLAAFDLYYQEVLGSATQAEAELQSLGWGRGDSTAESGTPLDGPRDTFAAIRSDAPAAFVRAWRQSLLKRASNAVAASGGLFIGDTVVVGDRGAHPSDSRPNANRGDDATPAGNGSGDEVARSLKQTLLAMAGELPCDSPTSPSGSAVSVQSHRVTLLQLPQVLRDRGVAGRYRDVHTSGRAQLLQQLAAAQLLPEPLLLPVPSSGPSPSPSPSFLSLALALPVCSVSATAHSLSSLLASAVRGALEGQGAMQCPHLRRTVVPALLAAAADVATMYTVLVAQPLLRAPTGAGGAAPPAATSHSLPPPRVAALLHNDCVLLAHTVLRAACDVIAREHDGGATDVTASESTAPCRLPIDSLLGVLPALGDTACASLVGQVRLYRGELLQALPRIVSPGGHTWLDDDEEEEDEEDGGGRECGEEGNAVSSLAGGGGRASSRRLESCIRGQAHILSLLARAWSPGALLPGCVALRLLGHLGDACLACTTDQVTGLTHISAEASGVLARCIQYQVTRVTGVVQSVAAHAAAAAGSGAPSEPSTVAALTTAALPHAPVALALSDLLDAPLAAIRAGVARGAYTGLLAPPQLAGLVEALFQPSSQRAALLAAIAAHRW